MRFSSRAIAMRTMLALVCFAGCGGDGSSSGCPAFAAITNGTFTRTGTDLVWTLEVEAMSPITFDHEDAPANVLEYRWGVDLDSNRDGTVDLRVAASHFRRSGAPAVTTSNVLDVTQEDVWGVAPMGGAAIVGSAMATLVDRTFTFTTNDREDAGLAGVTDASQSTWITYYYRTFEDNCDDAFTP